MYGDDYWAFAWMCVKDSRRVRGFGRTDSFLLPPAICRLIDAGEELGTASDLVFKTHNSKQQGGTVGILTGGTITRADFYRDAITFALAPFINPDLYPPIQ